MERRGEKKSELWEGDQMPNDEESHGGGRCRCHGSELIDTQYLGEVDRCCSSLAVTRNMYSDDMGHVARKQKAYPRTHQHLMRGSSLNCYAFGNYSLRPTGRHTRKEAG